MSDMKTAAELSHYRVLDKIGEGGMGVVYRADDIQLRRQVALKLVSGSASSDRSRIVREARAAACLNHPNICTVYEIGESDGMAYIAMELVQGTTLSDRLTQGPLPAADVARIVAQIADGMAHAHEKGIVHRDLKCGNVIELNDGRVKILDFGLAKTLSRNSSHAPDDATRSEVSITRAGEISGTLAYMAPEQLRAEPADARSDIWAIGVILYELLTGVRPFEGATGFALSSDILNRRLAPLPGSVPLRLRAIVDRCLQKDPSSRYQTARELQKDIVAFQEGALSVISSVRFAVAHHVWASSISGSVLVIALAAVVSWPWMQTHVFNQQPTIRSIAVLPLEDRSVNKGQEYLADGITDELITELAKIQSIRVISHKSIMEFKGKNVPLAEIAKQLHVDAVVEGAVLRSGDRIRVTAQLVSARTDSALWAESYDRDLRDVLAVSSEVTRAIATQVKANITPQEAAHLKQPRKVNSEAYQEYAKGRYFLFDLSDIPKAIEHFKRAIDLDPTYAEAYAALGEANHILYSGGMEVISADSAVPKTREYVQKAIELNPDLAEAHIVLAMVHMDYDQDPLAAERELRRSMELNPSLSDAHVFYGQLLYGYRRNREAIEQLRKAQDIDPLNPFVLSNVAFSYWFAGDFDTAIVEARKALEVRNNYWLAYWVLGWMYQSKGMEAEAIDSLEAAARFSDRNRDVLGSLGNAYGRYHRRAQALKILEELQAPTPAGFVPQFPIAQVYAGLGDKELALQSLEKALAQHSGMLQQAHLYPEFNSLHSEPRFRAIVSKLGYGNYIDPVR